MDVYEIIKTIGSGSFGQVYLARHKREGKHYVIKRVKTRDMEQKDLENTENEVRLLQKIRHSNIVAYKDSYVDREQYLNIVMIYCNEGDIYSKVKASKGKNFSEDQILDWLVQMGLALFYLHERKILHRDMKTQNIFLKNGKIRLGDFGIAKVLDSTKDFANTCIGTPYYMSPELFKNKPYSYKSDVWALGCVLYEMCNLRHAFDAQSINGLAVKILRGSFPPINQIYSKQLRDLIGSMLQIKPSNRPTIVKILQKSFVRKKVTQYINDSLDKTKIETLEPTDVDDMFADGLREQAEKLLIPGYVDDSNDSNARLMKGKRPSNMKKKAGGPKQIKTQIEQKKEILRLKKEINEKKLIQSQLDELKQQTEKLENQYKSQFGVNPPKLPAKIKPNAPTVPKQDIKTPKQSQDLRKKSIDVKRRSNSKEISSKELQSVAPKMERGSSQKQKDHSREMGFSKEEQNKKHSFQGQRESAGHPQSSAPILAKDYSRGRLRPNDLNSNSSNVNIRNANNSLEGHQSKGLTGKGEHVSSSGSIQTLEPINRLEPTRPLNSYKEFANVFNVKGMMHGSKSRKHSKFSSENQSINSLSTDLAAQRLQSQQSLSQKQSPKNSSKAALIQGANAGSRSRERIVQDSDQRKIHREQELEKIRIENVKERQEAAQRQNEQYRHSQGNYSSAQAPNSVDRKKKQKKIQEEYSMYDEEEKGDEDDELADIIEEQVEEESEDSDDITGRETGHRRNKKDKNAIEGETEEQRQMRLEKKEELKNLKTQMLTMRDQIMKKATKIEEIKTTLKQSQLIQMQVTKRDVDISIDHQQNELNIEQQKSFIGGVPADDILDILDQPEDIIDKKLEGINEAKDPDMDMLQVESDEENYDQLDFASDEDDTFNDDMDNGIPNRTDPQILKLQDRIKFFRHRCVQSLGNNLYDRAYDFLKENNSEGASPEENREGLILILGEDWIGFWAILDQIMFYEGMIDELSTLNDTGSNVSEPFSDDDIGQRKNASGLGVIDRGKNSQVALNDDSDQSNGMDIDDENDGDMVGDSGSEKGVPM